MAAEYVARNNDFSRWADLALERIDRNGTHYYTDCRCPRCGGKGYLVGYEMIEGGVCFLCGGSGRHAHSVIVRTEEHEAKLTQRRLEKMRKAAPEANAKFLAREGFSADGKAYIVLGNTYEMRDKLKEAGAKYSNLLGWHFSSLDNANEFVTREVSKDTVVYSDDEETVTLLVEHEDGHLSFPWADEYVLDFIKGMQEEYRKATAPATFFYGAINDKVQVNVSAMKMCWFDTQWGTTWVYRFKDEEGHVFVWKTSSYVDDLNEGDVVQLKGTIKEHAEYRGVNQTVLTRCKVSK